MESSHLVSTVDSMDRRRQPIFGTGTPVWQGLISRVLFGLFLFICAVVFLVWIVNSVVQ